MRSEGRWVAVAALVAAAASMVLPGTAAAQGTVELTVTVGLEGNCGAAAVALPAGEPATVCYAVQNVSGEAIGDVSIVVDPQPNTIRFDPTPLPAGGSIGESATQTAAAGATVYTLTWSGITESGAAVAARGSVTITGLEEPATTTIPATTTAPTTVTPTTAPAATAPASSAPVTAVPEPSVAGAVQTSTPGSASTAVQPAELPATGPRLPLTWVAGAAFALLAVGATLLRTARRL